MTAEAIDGEPSRLCTTPNLQSRSSGRRVRPGAVDLFGYQEFTATANTISISSSDEALARKAALMRPIMRPAWLHERTVLDLGANNGYFSLAALRQGARRATAVDIDPDVIANLEAVRSALGLDRLDIVRANVADWRDPADCVFALALSHWLCACTATLGSLEAVVDRFAALTRHLLVIEFVDASDEAVQSFGHLCWEGRETVHYSREHLEQALARHFRRVRQLGHVTPTRSLYAASRTYAEIDLSCPLPLIHPAKALLSCRRLATIDGIDLWSAVFDLGDVIVKQTTGTLALHEAGILNRMQGAAAPAVLGQTSNDGWSTLTMERVAGTPLADEQAAIGASRARLVRFAHGCLAVLADLRWAGVAHRDIHALNVIVRDERPVLIDFGWAVASGMTIEAPQDLWAWGEAMTEPGATPEHCDVRDMGRLLVDISAGRHPDLDALFGVMAEPDQSLRIVDLVLLRRWLRRLAEPRDETAATRRDGLRQLLVLADGRHQRTRTLAVRIARAKKSGTFQES